MAGTTTSSRPTGVPSSDVRDLCIQFNKLVADVELIRAWATAVAIKLDADAGVTDTNYAAAATMVLIDTAAELTAAKIGNAAGTAITA